MSMPLSKQDPLLIELEQGGPVNKLLEGKY